MKILALVTGMMMLVAAGGIACAESNEGDKASQTFDGLEAVTKGVGNFFDSLLKKDGEQAKKKTTSFKRVTLAMRPFGRDMNEYEGALKPEDYTCEKFVEPFDLEKSLEKVVGEVVNNIKGWFENISTGNARSNGDSRNKRGNSNKNDEELIKKMKGSLKRVNWMSMEMELQYGELLHKELEKGQNKPIPRDNEDWQDSYQKADDILKRILASVDEEYPYEFKLYLVNSSEQNASALPGGYLYVSEAVLDTPHADLVIAHEVAHVLKRHQTREFQALLIDTYENIQDIKDLQKIKKMSLDEMTMLAREMIAFGKSVINYSKQQELQADACAARIVSANSNGASFDREINSFAEALAEQEELSGGESKWFSSHPRYPERKQRMKLAVNKSKPNK